MKKEKEENRKTGKLIVLLLLLLLLILLAFFFISHISASEKHTSSVSNNMLSQILDKNQTNEEIADTDIETDPDITLPGFTDMTISAHKEDVHLYTALYNPLANAYCNCPDCNALLEDYHCPRCNRKVEKDKAVQNKYYLKFEIYLAENNELLYSSDLVCPGYRIENIKLNKALDVGDYEAYVFMQPYRSDMATACNSGTLNITLHVTDTI